MSDPGSSKPANSAPAPPVFAGEFTSRGRIGAEVLIVLGLSLGSSAVYSIVRIVYLLNQETALSQQTAELNQPISSQPVFDLIYQLLAIVFGLVPVALVVWLLWNQHRPHLARFGVSRRGAGRDLLFGVVIVLVIGLPGLGVYLGGRALGISVNVVPSPLDTYWWTIPVLVLSALRAGLSEEFIVIGYLYARLADLGWNRWTIIVASAVFRGSYHLYQGFGAFVGNFAMGVFFGWLYTRYGRLLPLVVAHTLLDAAIFIGYPWAASAFPALFG